MISMAVRSVQDGSIVSRDSASAEFTDAFLIQPNDIFASEQFSLRQALFRDDLGDGREPARWRPSIQSIGFS